MNNEMTYDYESSWKRYAYEEEEERFLSSSEEDLLKICDCIDLRKNKREKTSGGIPIHYENDKLYVLKSGPHTRVQGESGSKKSRTICRGAAVSAALNGDSFCISDPKGEISEDPKIQYILKKQGYDVYILDLRKFDKDGFNLLGYIADMKRKGKEEKAMDAINRFVGMLVKVKKTVDDFWNDQAGAIMKAPMQFTLQALAEKHQLEDYHLATIRSYIRQDKDELQNITRSILREMPSDCVYNPLQVYADILDNPEKTYACIISSANALLNDFCSSEALLRMLSVNTFDIKEFYRKPSALFLVVPDEVSAYDALTGYLFDTMYQILVDEFNECYQNKKTAPCNIKFICDEVASIQINDMASKISASRSRQIDWTLIYQSDKQMMEAYEKDFPAICGNCKTNIFLGSSDYDILRKVSEQTGKIRNAPAVSIEDLRRMKKEWEYKEALVMRDNYLYCAKLPDYDTFTFLKKMPPIIWENHIKGTAVKMYRPEDMAEDFRRKKVKLNFNPAGKNISDNNNYDEEDIMDIQKELEKKFDELFGSPFDDDDDDDFDDEF